MPAAAILVLFLTAFVVLFFIIARKGRELRKNKPLPPKADRAYIQAEDGRRFVIQPGSPFYMGNSSSGDVQIASAKHPYEICIFYHRQRFAFQTPSGVPGLRVNDEEQLAGYLFDGDVLTIGGEKFVFRLMPHDS